MAFTLISGGSALPAPALTGRTPNDAAGFASCYGPHRRSPFTGLLTLGSDPARFQTEPPALLPGLLAATRTGLPPAGDNELTNTKIHHNLGHGFTSRPTRAHITAHYLW